MNILLYVDLGFYLQRVRQILRGPHDCVVTVPAFSPAVKYQIFENSGNCVAVCL